MTKVKATAEDAEGGKPRIVWKFNTDDSAEFFRLKDAGKEAVSGARFRPSDKVWTAPLTVDNCYALRRAYGEDLKIGKPLADWFVANREEVEKHTAASAATDAELATLPRYAPRLAATLRPDQRAGAAWLAAGYRGAGLVADQPGLGKTLITIAGIIEADIKGPILVVCPRISVRSVWWRELDRWTDEAVFYARGTRAKREAAIEEFWEADAVNGRKWLIVTAEMLRVKRKPNETTVKANAKKRGRVEGFEYDRLFKDVWPWTTVVCDESHRLLGSLTVAKSNLMGEGLANLPTTPDSRRYAISGTPFGRGGRVQGMFGTLHWLWPDEYRSFWRWAGQHFDIEEETIRRHQTAKKIVGLKKGLGAEEFLRSLGPRILRRTKAEVLPNLPPKQYVEVLCEMEGEQLRQYKRLGEEAEVNLPGGILMANGVLAEMTRAKQIANGALEMRGEEVGFQRISSKVDRLMEMLETRGLTGGDGGNVKLIISSRFNAFLEDSVLPALEDAGVKYHLLTGATKDSDRERQMEEFQSADGPNVFVLNSKAGGVSITLDAADEVHCLDELDNPEDNEQLEDRAHRASRIHQVTIYYYRSEGTIDVNIAKSVNDKREAQFAVLDGRRGLADVRSWIKYNPEES